MKRLNNDIDLRKFYKKLDSDGPKLLFLDYDGTLAPFCDDPQLAYPYPGIKSMLDAIISNPTVRLVIITGRSISELQALLDLKQDVEIWGTHGHEHLLPNGDYSLVDLSPNQNMGLSLGVDAALSVEPLLRVEEKPGAVAFHWRTIQAKDVERFQNQLTMKLENISQHHELVLKKFDGGLELISPTMDKGRAVREVLREVTPNTTVAYLGDDLTDEDAFWELKYKGLTVLVRDELRETQANLWIQPPDELLQFLEKWK
ncbi:MAG: trehalose-phosphatase [Candidatus Marinimicrobia bacterium]|nr:trehalose-phosphatase [Candidatus Neomarinimicrobiota bacterium]